jgi:hypothetical protein
MVSKHHLLTGAAVVLAGMLSTAPAVLAADAGVKVGILTCKVEPGWSYVVGSTRDLNCDYDPNTGGASRYIGKVTKVGVDLGYSEGATMVWAVIAPTSDVGPDALEGDYGGASAGASVGIGAGANLLIGGFDKSITLQPLSVEGNTGINLAVGVTGLTLDHQA